MAWHLETFGFHLKSATCQLSRVAALVLALDGRLKRSSATRTNRIDGSLSRSQMKSGGKQLEGSTRGGGVGGGGCAKESWGPEVEKRSAQKRNHKFNLIYFAAVLYWRWTNSRLSTQMAELSCLWCHRGVLSRFSSEFSSHFPTSLSALNAVAAAERSQSISVGRAAHTLATRFSASSIQLRIPLATSFWTRH